MTTWLERSAQTAGRAVGAFQNGLSEVTQGVVRRARTAFLGAWAEAARWAGGDFSKKGSQQRALRNSWVFAASHFVAREVSAATLRVVKQNSVDSEPTQIPNHPLEIVLRRPNPIMGRAFLWLYTALWLELDGNGYWFMAPDEDGDLTEIWPLPAQDVEPWPGPDNRGLIDYFIYRVNGREYHIPPEYVVHFMLPNPFDIFRGLSPLTAAMLPTDADSAMAMWNGAFFGRDNVMPSAVINLSSGDPKRPIDKGDADMLKSDLKGEFGAIARKTAITTAETISAVLLGWNPREMDFIAGRTFTKDEIYEIFGVPPGITFKNATEANAESGDKVFKEKTLWPLLTLIAEQITAQLVMPFYGEDYEAQFDDVRPANRQLELQEITASEGYLTVDEVRRRYWKMEALPNGRGSKTKLELAQNSALPLLPSAPPQIVGSAPTQPTPVLPAPEVPADDNQPAPETTQAASETETIQSVALNGAQVSAAMDIVKQVGSGELTRESGLNSLQILFGLTEDQAMQILGQKAIGEPLDWNDDLRRWRTKAIKRFKASGEAGVEFESEVIPEFVYQQVAAGLRVAESVEDVRTAFAFKAIDDRPWSAFEREFFQALSRALGGEADALADAVASSGEEVITGEKFWEAQRDRLLNNFVDNATALIAFGVTAGREALGDFAPSVNWKLINHNAADWARLYAGDEIDRIVDTTKQRVRDVLAEWVEAGEDLPSLVKRIRALKNDEGTPIFNKVRAQMIAQTESTNIYASGNAQAWEAAGVAPAAFKPSAHIGCRCYLQPYKLPGGQWVMVWYTAKDDLVCVQPIKTPWGEVKGCRGLHRTIVSQGDYLGKKV